MIVAEESLHLGQKRLLELIARGALLHKILNELALLIEAQQQGLYCSVLLLDADGKTIRLGAGPNLPAAYLQALDGFEIGPNVGSCGSAMYRKQSIIVSDIETDPLWQPYKGLLAPYGFRACWSRPIILDSGKVLGTFAMYYREVRSATPDDLALLDVATHIASIAIDRAQREAELELHRMHLRELVDQRTSELNVAKERAEDAVRALTQSNHELAETLSALKLAQDELVRSKKLIALNSIVVGIAHELNTPIGNCMTMASTLATQTDSLSERYQSQGQALRKSELERFMADSQLANAVMLRNLERAAGLIGSFKQIAVDPAGAHRRRFVLADVVREAAHAARAPGEFHIDVQSDIAAALELDSYPGALGQVLANLLTNCRIHAFDGRDSGAIHIAAHPDGRGGMLITVTDNGAGIEARILDRVFDPFFTTKLGSGCCGLGLNIAHNIVTGLLGGRITCRSEAGKGATFAIELPLSAPG
ncbi:GAF domain-containing protein [Duganella sp. FT92W]|uniref:histidine kinase n=1 Tax=Pseudoduganella rivuli TaxID=2666085 RepID=A0A7X2IV11_9BURK|nr:GAF domain-containing protein [Pseudoduganella rivuli]